MGSHNYIEETEETEETEEYIKTYSQLVIETKDEIVYETIKKINTILDEYLFDLQFSSETKILENLIIILNDESLMQRNIDNLNFVDDILNKLLNSLKDKKFDEICWYHLEENIQIYITGIQEKCESIPTQSGELRAESGANVSLSSSGTPPANITLSICNYCCFEVD